jgi:hypothetical protein
MLMGVKKEEGEWATFESLTGGQQTLSKYCP